MADITFIFQSGVFNLWAVYQDGRAGCYLQWATLSHTHTHAHMFQYLLKATQWALPIFSAHNAKVQENGILGRKFEEAWTESVMYCSILALVWDGLIDKMKIIRENKKVFPLSFARAQLLAHCIYVYLRTSAFKIDSLLENDEDE